MPRPGDRKSNGNGLSTLRSQGLAEGQQVGQQLQSGFIKEETETCGAQWWHHAVREEIIQQRRRSDTTSPWWFRR